MRARAATGTPSHLGEKMAVTTSKRAIASVPAPPAFGPHSVVRRRLERLRRPGRAWRSLTLSFAYGGRSWWRVPIIAAWSARIECERGGELRVGRRLVLGYDAYAPRPGIAERGRAGAVVWLWGKGSRIETDGVVMVAEGVQLSAGGGGRLTIGDGTHINANTSILCTDRIAIGNDCAISWGVQIIDFDGHDLVIDDELRRQAAPIQIGNHVWIGAHASILKGVSIGDGAIIAADATVTHDVPAGTLVAGNPARVVHEDVDWR